MKDQKQQNETKKRERKENIPYDSPDIQVIDVQLETSLFAGSDNTTPGFGIE